MKLMTVGAMTAVSALSLGAGLGRGNSRTFEVTFTNLTQGVILTPPIFSVSANQIDVFELGQPAGLGLEMLAEGGATDELRAEWEAIGVQDVMQTTNGVMPGKSVTVTLTGDQRSRLNIASMLLPTNDGFVAVNGRRIGLFRDTRFVLKSYDAGTEFNDEACANIPGPQCGGEGFNITDGEGHVAAHAGIHGEGELSRQSYNWGEPVARVSVRVMRD